MEHRRSAVTILSQTFQGYRRYIATLFFFSSLSAVFDGISIASIVPLVSFLTGNSAGGTDIISRAIRALFELLHVPYSFRYLIIFIGILLLMRALILGLFAFVRAYATSRFLEAKVVQAYGLMLNAEWSLLAKEKAGHLQNAILWDTRRTATLMEIVMQLGQSFTGFCIYLFVAISISPGITLVTLVGGGVLLFLLRPFVRRTRIFGNRIEQLEKDLAQHVTEHTQGFKVIKASGVVPQVSAEAREIMAHFRSIYAKTILVQNIGTIFVQPFTFFFAMMIFAFTYYVGTLNLAAFAATLYLIQKIFVYIDSTNSALNSIVQYLPFAESLQTFIERTSRAQEKVSDAHDPFSFTDSLDFKNVSYSYRKGTPVLNDISFSIKKGTTVGIVGPSGSGKTTTGDLILRMYTPDSGAITMDDKPVDTIRLADWRHQIAYVSQDAFLMHTSVKENIRFYDQDVSDEDIVRAAKEAHVYDEVMRLPEKFDTLVGDRGVSLSGGQRQRIALARALARKPQVLVLDEVTSALDSELEAQIQGVIRELHGKITLIIITHRISSILNADHLIAIQEGKIVEQGDPQEILKNPNSYLARIVQMQSGGAQE